MGDDASGEGAATRRDDVKYGSALVAGDLPAGCAGDSGSDGDRDATESGTPTPTSARTGTEARTATETGTATATAEATSYTVSMAPMGEVTHPTPADE